MRFKSKHSLLILLVLLLLTAEGQTVYGQTKGHTDEELKREHNLWNTPIPIKPYVAINSDFFTDWIYYRAKQNPNFTRKDWFDENLNRVPEPSKLILGDTIDIMKYNLRYTIRPWPDSTFAWYDMQKIYGLGDYYLVEKKGNVFQRRLDGYSTHADSIAAIGDTISVNAFSEYYPYDERFLYYYDRERDELLNISGNMGWTKLRRGITLDQFFILIRLAQYDVKHVMGWDHYLSTIPSYLRKKGIMDTLETHTYYAADYSLLTSSQLLIKIPNDYHRREYSSIELFYYTTLPKKTGDPTGKKMVEYHYTIPTYVKLVSERYPKKRELSEEEKNTIMNSNLRFFVEYNLVEEEEEYEEEYEE